MLSIDALLIMVLLVLELVSCLWVRQPSIIGRNRPMAAMRVIFVFFIVPKIYYKGNKLDGVVQV